MNSTIRSVVRVLSTERLALLLLFFSAAIAMTIYNADVFLHLATGRYLLEHNAFPQGDPFSFTHSGLPWHLHEWLYQVGLYSLYAQFGGTGVKLVTALLFILVIYLIKQNCELAGGNRSAAWMVTLLGLGAWVNFLSARPHMLSFLFVALTLNALLQYRNNGEIKKLYLIPVIMLFWVNSHGAFLLGIVLLGYFLLIQAIENRVSGMAERPLSPIFYSLLFSLVAAMLNPSGFEQLLFPFQLAGQWAVSHVAEWQPPELSDPTTVVYLLMVLALIGFSLVSARRDVVSGLVISMPFIAASVTAMRHVPIAVIVISPFLARAVDNGMHWLKERNPDSGKKNTHGSSVVARKLNSELDEKEYLLNWGVFGLSVVLVFWLSPMISTSQQHAIREGFPVGAVSYLENKGVTGRMFSPMEYSDYILFKRYPEQKVFYDMRVEMYGNFLAKEYLQMLYARDGWKKKFEQYRFDFAVLKLSNPLYSALLNNHLGKVVYRDKYNVIVMFNNNMTPKKTMGVGV